MIKGMDAALSGLRAYIGRTQTAANNIANINTPGFKYSRANQSSLGTGGAYTSSIQTIHGQGSIATTGNAFDIAISGSGFFKVETAPGMFAYTRAGSFHIDSKGRMADSSGNIFSPGINIPGSATGVTIGRDGTVTGMEAGSQKTFGKISIYSFNNPSGLERGGGGLYFETANSGQPVEGVPANAGFGELVPFSIELSNVELGSEMVSLIESQTGMAAQIKTIQAADEMLGALLDIKA